MLPYMDPGLAKSVRRLIRMTLATGTQHRPPPFMSPQPLVDRSAIMSAASALPTPPSSPLLSSRKSGITNTAPAAIVPAALPLQCVEDIQPSPQLLAATAAAGRGEGLGAENASLRTIAVLKEDLCINDWRCGAQRQQKPPCRILISKTKQQRITSQLADMIHLTRTSPDLDSALLKLVMLVHCRHHAAGEPRVSRLQAWRLTFPSGTSDDTQPDVPIEEQISEVLGSFSVECITQIDGQACKKKVGGQKVQNCKRTLQELVKQDVYSSDTKLEFLLRVLEWNRTCSDHESSRHFACVAAWMESIKAVLSISKIMATRQPIDAVAPIESRNPARVSKDIAMNLDKDPSMYWPRAYDTSSLDIIEHAKHLDSHFVAHKVIRTKILQVLEGRDHYEGFIYAYEVEGNNGYIKIGYTTRTITERHYEWSFDCNRQTKPIYPLPPSSPPPLPSRAPASASTSVGVVAVAAIAPVARPSVGAATMLTPHARRVEALCHAELDHRRIRVYCSACLKQHVEWFEVSAAEATAIIEKWSKWMATRPYEPLQLRNGLKWKLKTSEAQRVSKIEQFMRELSL